MIKKTEMIILANLRRDSRQSLTNMSRRTCIPVSTIYDRIKNYEGNVIKKYTMIVDFSKLGFSTRAVILIKSNKDNKEELKSYLVNNKNLNSVVRINNFYDYMLEGIFRDLKGVEIFLEKLETEFAVTEKHIYYIIEELKKESFMSNPDYVKIANDFV